MESNVEELTTAVTEAVQLQPSDMVSTYSGGHIIIFFGIAILCGVICAGYLIRH